MARITAIILIVAAIAAGLWWVLTKPRAIHLDPLPESVIQPADPATPVDNTPPAEDGDAAAPPAAPDATAPAETDAADAGPAPEEFDAPALIRQVEDSDAISAAQKTTFKALIEEAAADATLRPAVLDQLRAVLK